MAKILLFPPRPPRKPSVPRTLAKESARLLARTIRSIKQDAKADRP